MVDSFNPQQVTWQAALISDFQDASSTFEGGKYKFKFMQASVLAVGTELTVGQVTNRNSQWISSQLKKHGVETFAHLTVPDDRKIILDSLFFLESKAEILFVTGGLGPTSDDFTRDLVNQWANDELIFNEDSWKHIQSILTPRGIPLRESQKSQCYFPKSAQILVNDRGTANGFYIHVRGIDVFVLPGPPREIEAIWNSSVNHWIKVKAAHLDPSVTLSWDTMGLGESEIAHLTEEAILNSGLEIGYRVHLPYVEVKATFKNSRRKDMQPYIQKLETALGPYTWLRNGESAPHFFAQQILKLRDLEIIDEATQGYLWTRIKDSAIPLLTKLNFAFSTSALPHSHFSNQIHIVHAGFNRIEIRLKMGKKIQHLHVESPYLLSALSERRYQYFAELILISVARYLDQT